MGRTTDPEIDGWYDAEALQDAFFEIAAVVGEATLVDAGVEIVALTTWPDGVETVADALREMDTRHADAHRNAGDTDIGGYQIRKLDDGAAFVDCGRFPYPASVARGTTRGTVASFAPDARTPAVQPVD